MDSDPFVGLHNILSLPELSDDIHNFVVCNSTISYQFGTLLFPLKPIKKTKITLDPLLPYFPSNKIDIEKTINETISYIESQRKELEVYWTEFSPASMEEKTGNSFLKRMAENMTKDIRAEFQKTHSNKKVRFNPS